MPDIVDSNGRRHAIARAEYPCARKFNPLAETLHQRKADVVAAVEFVGEAAAVIQVGKMPVSPRKRITKPSGKGTGLFLCKQLHAIACAFALQDFMFPQIVNVEECCSFLVFQHVAHGFVISFEADFVIAPEILRQPDGHLI